VVSAVVLKNDANVTPFGTMRLRFNVWPLKVNVWLDVRVSERAWKPTVVSSGNRL